MEIFKLLESTMGSVQPGHSIRHLRRDQLLDNYEAAAKTLQTLIRAKESEITYRKDLIKMMEESKSYHDNRLLQAKQEYQTAKSHLPENFDIKSINVKSNSIERSTTPPLPPPSITNRQSTETSNTISAYSASQVSATSSNNQFASQSSTRSGSELDVSMHGGDSHDQNRSSLDRRLSEFLKTFPNLTQTGIQPPPDQHHQSQMAPKPTPGYYTQQPPPPPPPSMIQMSAAPPSMELLRFPPPNMMPPTMTPTAAQLFPPPPPGSAFHHHLTSNQLENHEAADMELSDHEESSTGNQTNSSGGGVLPMVAAAMQQGAGGKNFNADSGGQQQFGHNSGGPVQYAPRLNPLPFDPAIMDPGLRGSHSPNSNSSRDRHSDRSSGRNRNSAGSNHGSSSKNRYSSSSSTSSHSSSTRDKSRR